MCTLVHTSVTKWYIVGYWTGKLFDLCNGSISRHNMVENWAGISRQHQKTLALRRFYHDIAAHASVKILHSRRRVPDSNILGTNMGPTWVLSAPDGPMLATWTLLSGVSTYINKRSLKLATHVYGVIGINNVSLTADYLSWFAGNFAYIKYSEHIRYQNEGKTLASCL